MEVLNPYAGRSINIIQKTIKNACHDRSDFLNSLSSDEVRVSAQCTRIDDEDGLCGSYRGRMWKVETTIEIIALAEEQDIDTEN